MLAKDRTLHEQQTIAKLSKEYQAAVQEEMRAFEAYQQTPGGSSQQKKTTLVLRMASLKRESAEQALRDVVPATPATIPEEPTSPLKATQSSTRGVSPDSPESRREAKARFEDLRQARLEAEMISKEYEAKLIQKAPKVMRAHEAAIAKERAEARARLKNAMTEGLAAVPQTNSALLRQQSSQSSLSKELPASFKEVKPAPKPPMTQVMLSSAAAPTSAMTAREQLFKTRNERLLSEHYARTMRNHGDYIQRNELQSRSEEGTTNAKSSGRNGPKEKAELRAREAAERRALAKRVEEDNKKEEALREAMRMRQAVEAGVYAFDGANLTAEKINRGDLPVEYATTQHEQMVERAQAELSEKAQRADELRLEKRRNARERLRQQTEHQMHVRARAARGKLASSQAQEAQERLRLKQEAVQRELIERTRDEEARRDKARSTIDKMEPLLHEIDPKWVERHSGLRTSASVTSTGGGGGEETTPRESDGGASSARGGGGGKRVDAWVKATTGAGGSPDGRSPGRPVERAWDSGAIDKSWRRMGPSSDPPVGRASSASLSRSGSGASNSGGGRRSPYNVRIGSAKSGGRTPPPPPPPPELASAFEAAERLAGPTTAKAGRWSPSAMTEDPVGSVFVRAIMDKFYEPSKEFLFEPPKPPATALATAADVNRSESMTAREKLFATQNERLLAEHSMHTMKNHGDYVMAHPGVQTE